MQVKIKNPSTRIILEKVDNGVIFYEIGDDNVVVSKIVYEMYYKDGIINFETMEFFFEEIMESLKIPMEEPETNRRLDIQLVKIDPEKPSLGDDDEDEDDE